MGKTNIRTLQMMDAFVERIQNGEQVVISEIADEFNVSESIIYRSKLAEIAKRLGMEREELLQRVFSADHSGRIVKPVKPVDRSSFEARYKEAMKDLSKIEEDELKEKNDD